MAHDVNLTIGHVLRHAPSRGGQGLEAALIDIAQVALCDGRDRTLLLRLLHELPNTNLPHGTCW